MEQNLNAKITLQMEYDGDIAHQPSVHINPSRSSRRRAGVVGSVRPSSWWPHQRTSHHGTHVVSPPCTSSVDAHPTHPGIHIPTKRRQLSTCTRLCGWDWCTMKVLVTRSTLHARLMIATQWTALFIYTPSIPNYKSLHKFSRVKSSQNLTKIIEKHKNLWYQIDILWKYS